MTNALNNEIIARAWLAAIVDSSDDAIISKGLNGIIHSWNPAAERIFGYPADEIVGKQVLMLIPDDRLDEEPQILERLKKGERIEHFETIRKHKDGHLVDISLTISPILDDDGTVIGASKIAHDITARKINQLKIEKLAAIVESSSDAIVTKDLNGIITSWNRGAEEVFGYASHEAIGQSITMLIPPERVDEEPSILNRIRAGESVNHYETVRRRKDGRLIGISLSVSPVYDAHGRIIEASKIARDITEHKRVLAAERAAETMQQLVHTQESERNRLARDLHDHIGQQMTAFRLSVEHLVTKPGPDHDAISEIDNIRKVAEKMDSDLAFLSWELRPTEIEVLGLTDALRSFAGEWSRQYGIEMDFDVVASEVEMRLSSDLETNLYRIMQEALNNVLKHAAARKVRILFNQSKTTVNLVIEDNGKGFDPAAVSKRSAAAGQGINGMKERTKLLDGTFSIESVRGKGTTVFCRIPVTSIEGA